MNAVEIEEAITALSERPFDPGEFPYAFLEAFGNKDTTIKRLRSGASNKSDLGGVLQTNNIHIMVCQNGEVTKTLLAIKSSTATARAKVRFTLATDGAAFEAEDLTSGETVSCDYADFPNHFGFFLPLAGITTVKQIRESSFDIRATSRLNRLYVELLKDNPEWGTAARRHDMNHFMARLIFCFFAEDTDIFNGKDIFTSTVEKMSERDSSNTHEVISELFRAMNTKITERTKSNIPRWANIFPYVNGGLFSGSSDVPHFSRIARSYLVHIGNLDWKKINPDIFGSMIQAVAEDEERGALGMHYTSVPNILKVLNPLFLDDLRERLVEAGANARKLLNLRQRISCIRVFDPACGSGNFLVIAYKEMRSIEAEINRRRSEEERKSAIPLTNFRGIEIKDFPAEIARLALIIAEFQCDVLYRGPRLALEEFLPLNSENWITCGNALNWDWLSICPPTGTVVRYYADDLFHTLLDQPQIDFENTGGETYICGNPPYQGSQNQTHTQKEDMARVLGPYLKAYKDLDYVASWLVKAAEYSNKTGAFSCFVTTNSLCQGEQVGMLWPILFKLNQGIFFAHTSFKWSNNASNNAGVTCIVVGLCRRPSSKAVICDGETSRVVSNISPYLIPSSDVIVTKANHHLSGLPEMVSGNKATDAGNLIFSREDVCNIVEKFQTAKPFFRRLEGAKEFIQGTSRWCLWLSDADLFSIDRIPPIVERIEGVRRARESSRGKQANEAADFPHRFVYAPHRNGHAILVPFVSSERRKYLPCGLFDDSTIIVAPNQAIYDAPVWCLSIVSSTLHLVWIAAVCGKLETRYRYSNTLGWNTFPVPTLTEKNKSDLTRCAENILLVRETHFPSTIADLYDPDSMPADLREAHEHNDEVLERIYIGRRFKNDTERLEKLFELYTKMTAGQGAPKKRTTGARA